MGSRFLAVVNTTPRRESLLWKSISCLACGWEMVSSGAFLGDLQTHVCISTSEGNNWKQVVRDALLDGRDEEAIAIICEMRDTRETERFADALRVGFLRASLTEALTECQYHNNDYHHQTPPTLLDKWREDLRR